MYTFVVLATLFCAANAGGIIAGGASFASGPALGAPLLGSVSYNAPEVSVVKQPITIDQPEVRYRSVPVPYNVEVPSAPIVKTTVVQPAVYAAPAVSYAAAPVLNTVAAAPAVYAAPGLAYNGLGYNGLGYNGLGYNTVGLNSFTYNNAGLGYAGGLVL